MAAPTVVVACPGVGRRRGGKRVCAGFRAQTRRGFGGSRPAGTPSPCRAFIMLMFETWNIQYRGTMYVLR